MELIFSSKNIKWGHKLQLAYLYACWIMHTRHAYEALFQIWKWLAKSALILGRSVTKLSSSNCGAHLIDCYCQESKISKTTWLRYLFLYLIKIWLHILWRHHLANLHSLKTWISLEWKKRYLKIVYSIFLLIQTTCTCLCFKMAPLGKMQFSW